MDAKPERVSTGTASTPGDAELDEEGPLDADEVGESEDSDEHGTKIIHRGVPTWKETVEVLIAANLESRARRPERGPPNRSRNGNRNRGGRE